jgi:iron(III) transport system ATP-binding protein
MYITHDQAEAFALADRVGVLERGNLVQVGIPEEIYTQPASPFVARFTGLSGEFTVRIRGTADDGTIEVEPAGAAGGRPFRARRPREVPGSGTGLLMVRPTGVRLVEHHLAGTVADVAFRGRGYEHAIDLPGYGRLTGVFASARAGRGERVGLRLEPEGCHVFPVPLPEQGPPGRQPAASGEPSSPHADGVASSPVSAI